MPELIDRFEAIQRIKNDFCSECDCEYGDASCKVCEYDFCIGILNEMPTIEPEVRHGRWIPVEDALPETTGYYLVWTDSEIVDIAEFYIFADFVPKEIANNYWNKASKVLYWMSLPEPYCMHCGAQMDGGADND